MGKICPIVMRRFRPTLLVCACLLPTVQSKAVAFDLKGRTVTLYVGGGPGGGVDIFARTLAPCLGRHLPGEPVVVVSNMPGNGGMQAVQYAYNIAAKDGTAVGTTNSGPVVEPLLSSTMQLNYEIPKFLFVGSLLKGDMTCAVWHGSPIKTLQDAREREVAMSSTGATSSPLRTALLVNTLIGTRFKPISGFHVGTALLALERGEVDGICNTLSSLRTSRPDWLREGKYVPLVQVSLTGDPEIPHVPRVVDFVKGEDERQLLEFSGLPYEFDNPLSFLRAPVAACSSCQVARRRRSSKARLCAGQRSSRRQELPHHRQSIIRGDTAQRRKEIDHGTDLSTRDRRTS